MDDLSLNFDNDEKKLKISDNILDNDTNNIDVKPTSGIEDLSLLANAKSKTGIGSDNGYSSDEGNTVGKEDYNFFKEQKERNETTKHIDVEENDNIGDVNYLQNTTSYKFDDSNSISFSTRKNKKIDLTEYYDLIYSYQNDCLTASIEYNKEYYVDNDLKPTEQLFFSLTIVPLGSYETKNILPN